MLTGISNKILSPIKAESERVVLAPQKQRSDGTKPSDFDKCEICITQTRQQTIYNKKKIFDFGFRTTISSLLFKKN